MKDLQKDAAFGRFSVLLLGNTGYLKTERQCYRNKNI